MNPAYDQVLRQDDETRAGLFTQTAQRLASTPQNAEKGFWVCWTLAGLNFQFGGFREKGAASVSVLKRALVAYSKALSVLTKEAHFDDWLSATTNRAIASRQFGTRLGRQGGLAAVEDAVAAYDEIEAGLPAGRELEMARTYVNLSTALTDRAMLTDDIALQAASYADAVSAGSRAGEIYEARGVVRS